MSCKELKFLSGEQFDNFKCAFSKDDHILKDPLNLKKCGHFMCKDCFKKVSKNSKTVKCQICFKINENSEIVNNEESVEIKNSLEYNIEMFLKLIQRKLNESKNILFDLIERENQKINSKVEFVKQEVEIRIESIKIELDGLGEKFFEQLDELREKNLNESYKIHKIEQTNSLLEKLRNEIENKTNKREELLYEYQNELKCLNSLIEKISSSSFNLRFNESSFSFTDNPIGYLSFFEQNSIQDKELSCIIKEQDFEEIILEYSPNDLCLLPNNMLALSNSTQKNITIHDDDLSLIKIINRINDETFHPLRLESNNENFIYITEFSKCQVIMTDLNFNKIKSVGSMGSSSDQFNYPNGIALLDHKLYVADTENKRIHVLSEDLNFERIQNLDFEPWIIKISNDRLICISRFDKPGLYFYDFDSFICINHYDDHGYGRLSKINSYFFELEKDSSKLYFYDKNGNLIEDMDMKRLGDVFNSHADGIMVYHNKRVIFSSDSKKKLLKLKNPF